MSDIKYQSFGSLLKNVVDNRGKTCPVVDKGIPLIATNCVTNDYLYPQFEKVRYVNEDIYKNWFRGHPLSGDMIFVLKGTPGRVAWTPNPVGFCIAQDMVAIRADENKVYPKYLFAVLRSSTIQQEIEGLHVGSLISHFKKGDFHDLQIPIVKPDLQKFIGNQYFDISLKIDLLHRQNKTLEAMAETLFKQWFIIEARDDWEIKPLGEFVKVIDNRGKTPPYQDISTPYPIIEVNALTGKNRLVDYSAIRKYVSEETFNTWFRGHPKKFDSLISTVGSIGEISMFLVEKGCIAQNVIALSAINISPIYLFEFLKNAKDEIKELDIGSVQPSIKVPHLLSIKITVPPVEKIELFDNQVKSYLEKMLVNNNQIQTLEKVRDELLPKLMSGEVRVKLTNEK